MEARVEIGSEQSDKLRMQAAITDSLRAGKGMRVLGSEMH